MVLLVWPLPAQKAKKTVKIPARPVFGLRSFLFFIKTTAPCSWEARFSCRRHSVPKKQALFADGPFLCLQTSHAGAQEGAGPAAGRSSSPVGLPDYSWGSSSVSKMVLVLTGLREYCLPSTVTQTPS